ncbi:MAG TPA: FAD-dependent oxidoreductase [Pseudolabrys sp.]
MARTDAIVLGAGIVGTSIALQLAKRGLSVALVDRAGIGEQTSYGNSGVIEGSTILPPAFPSNLGALMRVAFKRASYANYDLAFLPKVAPWLLAFRAASRPDRIVETARFNRPLFAQALAEHELLMEESGATRYLRKTGWLKLYRSERAVAALAREFDLAREFGLPFEVLDAQGVKTLEPSLNPVFEKAVFWPKAASLSDPLAVTRAYAARFRALGGVTLRGDARSLHRAGKGWRVETNEGGIDAPEVGVALGPWAPDLLEPLGLKLPMAVKRGYHRHFRSQGKASLSRPVVDTKYGYLITPMAQGIRLTTGAEFAARDAPPTPVQFDRLMPYARKLFPLGERADDKTVGDKALGDKALGDKTLDDKTFGDKTWLGSRPCFTDSRPVIGRAPKLAGLWLAIGHSHWGLTLGPVTGRLLADMMTGAQPFCDPTPYRADRFSGLA